jgi:hypothetical protein
MVFATVIDNDDLVKVGIDIAGHQYRIVK